MVTKYFANSSGAIVGITSSTFPRTDSSQSLHISGMAEMSDSSVLNHTVTHSCLQRKPQILLILYIFPILGSTLKDDMVMTAVLMSIFPRDTAH